MSTSKGYEIVRVDLAGMSDDEILEAARLQQAIQQERVPEDPPLPIEVIVNRMRIELPSQWRAFFAARDEEGSFVGYIAVFRSLNEPENAHVRWTEVGVLPEHRRRGIGRALYRAAVDACLDQGDDLVFMGQTSDRVPAGEAFARSVAATPGLAMKTNQLDLGGVDRAKVAGWAKLDPAGYHLAWVEGPIPAPLVAPYIEAANAMNDAPKGDLRFNDEVIAEEHVRDRESFYRQAGIERWLVVALQDGTNEGAGFTEVTYDPRVPHLIWQQGTGVSARHRGHKLGLWMKAVVLDRILRERTAARYIRTGNANSNEWMLAINTQLGFRRAWSNTLWQLPVAEARTSLGLRGEAAGATA